VKRRAVALVVLVLALAGAARADDVPPTTAATTAPATSSEASTTEPIDAPEERARAEGARQAAAQAAASPWTVRSRHDYVFGWQARYRLDASADPLGLEQQLWRRVDQLIRYDRVSLDATLRIDEHTSVALHLSGWNSSDFLSDLNGSAVAGDVAIGYAELSIAPVGLWVGRRFMTYGPPGGLHVDGGGASVHSTIGLYADAFAGRPVTPVRTSLLGPQPSFDGDAFAYGARVGFERAGLLAISASYAELWARGMLGSRTFDVSGSWDPGDLHVEGNIKIDAASGGISQARGVAIYQPVREVAVDLDYLHVEPRRWIPTWSILSVFETNVYDEGAAGITLRPSRLVALRAEGAARVYSLVSSGEVRLGYRADLSARLMPSPFGGPTLRLQGSRRDDGTLGYTVITGGAALDVLSAIVITVDGAFALDDQGGRLSTIGRANVDWPVTREWTLGLTASLSRTPIADSETRAFLRVHWAPVGPGGAR
jgi:hypothetical protein